MSHFIGASDCCGPKADQSTGWQFESPTASKSDASGPEQVSGAIVAAPPEQVLLTRSAGLAGAQSPALRGAFCYGLLTDPMATLDL